MPNMLLLTINSAMSENKLILFKISQLKPLQLTF